MFNDVTHGGNMNLAAPLQLHTRARRDATHITDLHTQVSAGSSHDSREEKVLNCRRSSCVNKVFKIVFR